MMTNLLEEAFRETRALPKAAQNRLAHFIKRLVHEPEAVNGDAYWEMLLATPRSDALLERLVEEALAEHGRGETVDLDDFLKG